MHVLDIAQNSFKAGATLVTVSFEADGNGKLSFSVKLTDAAWRRNFLRA